jgi:hypothetical protein
MIQNNTGAVSGLVFKNNIFSACRGINVSQVSATTALNGVEIYNNTFHDIKDRGIIDKTSSGILAKNNIFYNVSYNINNKSVSGAYMVATSTSNVGYNNQYFSGQTAQPALSLWNNDQQVDPGFTGASSGNYKLTSGSSVIDKGIILSDVSDDFSGTVRPQGASYDIGAYEFVVANVSKSATTDVTATASAVCINGVCEDGESCSTCPGDCGACPAVCGNGSCENGETCSTCLGDCGACPAVCGNGSVESGEICDGSNLNGQTCAILKFIGGNLTCNPDCKSVVTSACTTSCTKQKFYRDSDGDGYGSTSYVSQCSQPAGYVANKLDCCDKVFAPAANSTTRSCGCLIRRAYHK